MTANTIIRHTIDGYELELEIYDGPDGRETQCWVSHMPTRTHGSLACVQMEGILTGNGFSFTEHIVPDATIERISRWAEESGY